MKLIGSKEKGYTLVSSFEKKEAPSANNAPDIPENAEGEKTKVKISKNNK